MPYYGGQELAASLRTVRQNTIQIGQTPHLTRQMEERFAQRAQPAPR